MEVEAIYKAAYKKEYAEMIANYKMITAQATDKLFAALYVREIYLIQYAINNENILSNQIKNGYYGMRKLGMSISDIINGIPEIKDSYKTKAERMKRDRKTDITGTKVGWKNTKIGIPIPKILRYRIVNGNSPYFNQGPFAHTESPAGNATELAKLVALEDFMEFLNRECGDVNIESTKNELNVNYEKLRKNLENRDLVEFFAVLQSIFARLPYQLCPTEATYHAIIHIMLDMVGATIISEKATNRGRIDSVIETADTIYIMEFKIDSDKALDQIEAKGYDEGFRNSDKKIILVGVNISTEKRNISNWTIK